MGRTVSLALFTTLLACRGSAPDCASLDQPEDRAWCEYERAAQAFKAGQHEESLVIASTIAVPQVRAAALDHLFSQGVGGVDQARANALCGELPEPHRGGCMRTWDRPHLWDGL